ncbi:Uu.00g018640.m01.CDS01 [Anthostomella pinea]|uniref:Uu.00g018640.m01.CDS01 n=1 Tax=Anthostomella pinea TaxID=933095 RepID=A0AAI8YQP7_9PEZI|nr:Uu.00g018640.m01.CDS01 [Anthostomella pinea]
MCLIGHDVKVNVIAPHLVEEPCIQGHNGSGSVFSSGCNLRCTFCQNHDIERQRKGLDLSPEELAGAMVPYGSCRTWATCTNIDLVTPELVRPAGRSRSRP